MGLLLFIGIFTICIPFAYVINKLSFMREMKHLGHANYVWNKGDQRFCLMISLSGPIALAVGLAGIMSSVDREKPAKW